MKSKLSNLISDIEYNFNVRLYKVFYKLNQKDNRVDIGDIGKLLGIGIYSICICLYLIVLKVYSYISHFLGEASITSSAPSELKSGESTEKICDNSSSEDQTKYNSPYDWLIND